MTSGTPSTSLLSPPPSGSLFSPNRGTSFGLGPASSLSGRNNPLTLRLYKVLGSSYSDPATYEALTTVSDFYADASDSRGVAARARKSLRKDTEDRLAEGSRRFLDAFGEVNSKLEVLEEHVTEMHTQCDDAQNQLQTAQLACKHLLEMSSSLLAQRKSTATKAALISLFLSRFTLTEAETEALTSREVPVGDRVLATLDSATRIREECRVLLTGEGGGTKAGTDIMTTTSSLLEKGHEKLARWASFELHTLARDPPAEVSPTLQEVIRRLRPYPDLLSTALSTFTDTRRTHLLSSFLAALTLNPTSRAPIELHAHDPIRYVGDMLAWIHGAVASEREFLESLFGIRVRRWVGEKRTPAPKGQELEEAERLVDEGLERVRAPLKVRVQQTIRSQESPLVTYKLYNLLQFYAVIIAQTVGPDAQLSNLLRELTDDAYSIFFEALAAQGRSLLRFLHPPDTDLSPPLELRSASHTLREIIEVYTSALVPPPSSPTTEELVEDDRSFDKVLTAALGPMEEMCRRVAELGGGGWNGKVFFVNCVVYMQGILAPFESAQAQVMDLQQKIEKSVEELVEEYYTKTLKDSGLAPILQAIETVDATTPLSHLPASSPAALSTALTAFSQFLASPLLSPPLLPAQISLIIHQRTLERVEQGYARICDQVRKPENRYEAAETVLGGRRPWGDRRVLRQIFGLAASEEYA
ncbi:oligomeric complex COG6 [Dacryopinax primogenitus]|uniref:Conserved oligomeric Golgi complex subunit 6 n=1 Tax=Dacryopinax primogenitus (strain DJM 731) TaxID=1858805 RepID=M5G327_DACPD|nr:oligomeric complex COG6 [Dacryopinax primogenitus]EJU04626.1 oligomeric complex COG6 [Dacryopinax primogenitus]